MKVLHLLRHAKSDRSDPALDDHERPLAKRGERACAAMVDHLRDMGFQTERVYVSTARRTRETYTRLKGALGSAPVAYRDHLYLADAGELLTFIRELPEIDSVLLIGHDPGFHNLATALSGRAGTGEADALAALRTKFPTGALCSIAFAVAQWREVTAGNGELVRFVRPRDLTD